MKLALVSHAFGRGDGQARVNYEIARQALREGHQVVLVGSHVDDDLIADGAEWLSIRPVLRKPALLRVVETALRVNRVMRLVHASAELVMANGFVTTKPHHVNAVHFVHHAWLKSRVHVSRTTGGPWAWYQWLYTRWNVVWERKAFESAQILVAVSERVAEDLKKAGQPESKISIIHNGVDINEFHGHGGYRKRVGLPDDVPIALFVGDIRTKRKNLDTVLKALVGVPDLHLAVVGAVAGSPFPRMADELGVSNRISFMDYRSDIAEIMRVCDILVHPSRYEPFALVILEAMASGLPVVTTGNVGASTLVNAASGIVIDEPESVSALRDALQELTDDPDRRQRMGNEARNIAENHTWATMAHRYLDLFADVSSGRSVDAVK